MAAGGQDVFDLELDDAGSLEPVLASETDLGLIARDCGELTGLGTVANRQGIADEAETHFAQALTLAEHSGIPHNATLALIGLASLAADRADQAEAAQLLERATALLRETGAELGQTEVALYRHAESTARAARQKREPLSLSPCKCLPESRWRGRRVRSRRPAPPRPYGR